jgi:hypothetical protein
MVWNNENNALLPQARENGWTTNFLVQIWNLYGRAHTNGQMLTFFPTHISMYWFLPDFHIMSQKQTPPRNRLTSIVARIVQ